TRRSSDLGWAESGGGISNRTSRNDACPRPQQACIGRLFLNCYCEVVPACHSAVSVVKNTCRFIRRQLPEGGRQSRGEAGRTHLITHDMDLVSLSEQVKHCVDEVS